MAHATEIKHGKPLVVITGASSGIGEVCARHFHKEGHPLLLLARRAERMEKEFGKLKDVLVAKVDVTKYDEIHAALEKAEKAYGPCDCLINNAGVFLAGSVVLFFLYIKATLAHTYKKKKTHTHYTGRTKTGRMEYNDTNQWMKERKSGTIINISSEAGKKNLTEGTVYCATKAAVNAISEGVRAEVATSGVRVTTISPGLVEVKNVLTEALERNKDKKEIYDAFTNIKKSLSDGPLQADDIADACLYVYKLPRRVCIREIDIAPTGQVI
ncbi:oxidoreductase, short-chain dehydrogenase/reductase family protein [Reticulomyxa filosa]|uniref:Oxidoreductase, short-chain dehydrogenase/reductase family protein n=1 Tax=Reticulomyxa filosa TaxID=46433 RepID=X6M2T8_RETFI|nr:oxidoreductase, short-chain dehydrogenase/reductase family protein [Reticulomyxa filosa]|eukprot:ETO07767.1 oxidoreductase, short-chain dehydrogenase/reductase family protein [Reticulomyxa filosa]